MRDGVQSEPAGGVEDAGEVGRRVADLGRVEPDAEELAGVRGQSLKRLGGVGRAEVAQEARDQPDVRAAAAALRSAAVRRPPMTSVSGTPRDRCICGSKNISTRVTPSARARSR